MELYSVIKNERPGSELVWKHPNEDFNNNTQLIVMESEEALFVEDGVVVEKFSGGRFTLNTENHPFIGKLRSFVSGGVSSFNCKVYFVDKTHKLELFWGTDSPIQLRDAEYGFAVGVRARGSYSIEIIDTKKFLIKLVGLNTLSYTEEDVRSNFRTIFQTKIKVAIATVMKNCNYTVLDMNTELENIAKMVVGELGDKLDEYGVRLVDFYIADISIPEDDANYKTINEAYAKAHAGRIEMNVQGDMWNKLTAKEITKDIANNSSSVAAAGAGIGMGMASANIFGNIANQLFSPMNDGNSNVEVKQVQGGSSRFAPKTNNTTNNMSDDISCPNCGNKVPKTSKFCGNCGNKMNEEYACKQCGTPLPSGSMFCGNCGTRREG